jgi:hypothetical protein
MPIEDTYAGVAVLDSYGRCPVREPPMVGEHTEEVPAEVGVAARREAGGAAQRP